jgi:hypothetical protein
VFRQGGSVAKKREPARTANRRISNIEYRISKGGIASLNLFYKWIEYIHSSIVIRHWSLVTGYWLLVTGCWFLVSGCWVMGTGPSSFVRIVGSFAGLIELIYMPPPSHLPSFTHLPTFSPFILPSSLVPRYSLGRLGPKSEPQNVEGWNRFAQSFL